MPTSDALDADGATIQRPMIHFQSDPLDDGTVLFMAYGSFVRFDLATQELNEVVDYGSNHHGAAGRQEVPDGGLLEPIAVTDDEHLLAIDDITHTVSSQPTMPSIIDMDSVSLPVDPHALPIVFEPTGDDAIAWPTEALGTLTPHRLIALQSSSGRLIVDMDADGAP